MDQQPEARGVFGDYLRLRANVRYYGGDGRELSAENLFGDLRGADPALRETAWQALCAAWEPRGEEAAALLARASREKIPSSAGDVFGVDPAPLLRALEHLRKPLHRELKLKASSAGAPGFRWCDLWAQAPAAPGGTAIALPDAMSALEKIFDRACEGGAAFLLQFIAAGRLHLEGDRPHCHTPTEGGPAHVYLPERFVRVLPADLPTIAHELGHALHCDLSERLSPGKPFGMIFAELFSQLMEELAWHELDAGTEDARQRQTLKLGRTRQDVFDFLLTPALLQLEEILVPAAKSGGLPLETIEKAQDKVMRKWFPASPAGAPFWMRAERFFNPELPFDGFVYMAGRALSMEMAARIERNGKLNRAELEDLARDTVSLDLKGYLAKHAGTGAPRAKDWLGMLGLK